MAATRCGAGGKALGRGQLRSVPAWLQLQFRWGATVAVSASASIVVGGGAARTPGSLPRNEEERRPGPALRPGLEPCPESREGNGAPQPWHPSPSPPAPPASPAPQTLRLRAPVLPLSDRTSPEAISLERPLPASPLLALVPTFPFTCALRSLPCPAGRSCPLPGCAGQLGRSPLVSQTSGEGWRSFRVVRVQPPAPSPQEDKVLLKLLSKCNGETSLFSLAIAKPRCVQ